MTLPVSMLDIECDLRTGMCGEPPPVRACNSRTELQYWFAAFSSSCFFTLNPNLMDQESLWLKSEFFSFPLLVSACV